MSDITSHKIYAPATVANVGSGYDVFSFAIPSPGDIIEFIPRIDNGIKIVNKTTSFPKMPLDPKENVTSHAMKNLMSDHSIDHGFDIVFHQKIRPGSGLGSSAASSCAGVFYLNEVLELDLSNERLIDYAREGERLACGSPIADNVASCINGGFNLVRSQDPLEVVTIDFPKDLFVVCIHPEMEILTEKARAVVPKTIDLEIAISQWSQTAALVAGLYKNDLELIGRATKDIVVEPHRKKLIKGFADVKQAAMKNGALNCSISGAGPTLFSFCRSNSDAQLIAEKMSNAFSHLNTDSDVYINKIDPKGIRILE